MKSFKGGMRILKKVCALMVLMVALFVVASCGSSGTSSDSGGGGDDSGGDSGGVTSGLHVIGQLQAGNYSASQVFKADTDTVTDVVAVNPNTGNVTCSTIAVDSSGAFTLPVTGELMWVLVFLNRLGIGSDMFVGQFQTGDLNTLPINATSGTVDLGTIAVDSAEGIATSDVDSGTILEEISLDSDAAEIIGGQDEISGRYSNPDMDGDGEIDCGQSDHTFMLDFHIRFSMLKDGVAATVADILNSFLSEAVTTTEYSMTGVYVSYLNTFSSATTGTVTFVNSNVVTSEGGAIPANTATSDVTLNASGSYNGYGPNITGESELPTGAIVFAFGDKALTFSNVQTPRLAELNAPTGRIFPFIKFNMTSASCTTNCTLSSVAYKWMKKTSTGWTAATLAELSTLMNSTGGYVSIKVNNDSSRVVGFTIPITDVEGTIDWAAANATLTGVTESEFTSMLTAHICNLGISYDDKLGMRYFSGIANGPGTCGGAD